MTQEEFDQLKGTVESLKNDFSTKLLASSVEAPLRAAIGGLDEKLKLLDRIKAFEDQLLDRIRTVEEQLTSWKVWIGVMGSVVTLLLGALGFLGYHSVKDWRDVVQQTVNKEVQDRTAIARELAFGLALQAKYPEFAKDHLKMAFDADPYDEPAVSAVLLATDSSDDWEMEKNVLQKLQIKPSSTPEFREPWTYNAIGLAAINVGLLESAFLDFAKVNFNNGVMRAGSDLDALWYLHSNFWRYYLAKNDRRGAQCEANRAAAVGAPDGPAETFDRAMKWRWFRVYFQSKRLVDQSEVERMYRQFSMPRKPGVSLDEIARKLSLVDMQCR